METIELIAVCAAALIALGAVVCAVTVGQIRRFVAQVREEERQAAREREAPETDGERTPCPDAANDDEEGADT